jgi:transcriptional regulator with XRE-family HTH domain
LIRENSEATYPDFVKKADMTQSELADKLNVTRQAVSKYELATASRIYQFL